MVTLRESLRHSEDEIPAEAIIHPTQAAPKLEIDFCLEVQQIKL